MRIAPWENYAFSNEWVTPEPAPGKCWHGIAIGPDSDEGVVLVDGHKLQAGRVLPLRSSGAYKLTRATGKAPPTLADLSEITYLLHVRRCQVMLFESPEELAVEVARPNGEYSSRAAQGNVAGILTLAGGAGVETRVLTIPFVGRRQALVRLFMVASTQEHPVRVAGRRWDPVTDAVVETTLVESTTTSTGGAPSTFSYVVGGTNEAESYHELVAYVAEHAAALGATCYGDGESIGEIGVR